MSEYQSVLFDLVELATMEGQRDLGMEGCIKVADRAMEAISSLQHENAELKARNERLEKILKEFVKLGACWEPEWDKKLNNEGDDVIETEIPCEECPYCKAKKATEGTGEE